MFPGMQPMSAGMRPQRRRCPSRSHPVRVFGPICHGFDKKSIQLRGKGLAVFPAVGRRAARHQAAVPEAAQEIADGEPVFDVIFRVELASRVDGEGALRHDAVRKRYVRRHDEIAGCNQLNDAVVGDIRPLGDKEVRKERRCFQAYMGLLETKTAEMLKRRAARTRMSLAAVGKPSAST